MVVMVVAKRGHQKARNPVSGDVCLGYEKTRAGCHIYTYGTHEYVYLYIYIYVDMDAYIELRVGLPKGVSRSRV